MTETSIITPENRPSTLDAWIHEIEIAGGPFMSAKKLEQMLDTAPPGIKQSAQYLYWRGVADAHQIHLYFGGVAALDV